MRWVDLKKEFFKTKPLLMSTTEMKLQGFGFGFNDSNRFFLKKQYSFMIMEIDTFKALNLFNKNKKQRQKPL